MYIADQIVKTVAVTNVEIMPAIRETATYRSCANSLWTNQDTTVITLKNLSKTARSNLRQNPNSARMTEFNEQHNSMHN